MIHTPNSHSFVYVYWILKSKESNYFFSIIHILFTFLSICDMIVLRIKKEYHTVQSTLPIEYRLPVLRLGKKEDYQSNDRNAKDN